MGAELEFRDLGQERLTESELDEYKKFAIPEQAQPNRLGPVAIRLGRSAGQKADR